MIRRFPLIAGLASLLVLAACVAPALDSSDYRYKASLALQEAHSSLESARLSIELLDRHGLPIAPVEVLTRDAEGTISDAGSLFGSVKPPDEAAEAVRDKVLDLLDLAAEPVTDARVALQSGNRTAAIEAMEETSALSDELASEAEELSK